VRRDGSAEPPRSAAAIGEILQGGKACGILASVEADARKYLEMGMTFVAVGGDTSLLRRSAVALAQRFES